MKKYSNSKILIHILTLSVVLVMAVGSTFSWYNRTVTNEAKSGNQLSYTRTGNVTGKGGTLETYVGIENNGAITYPSLLSETKSLSTEPGAINHFKTVIKNNSTAKKSVASVYLNNFTYDSDMAGYIKVGLSQPEKTYKSIGETICLEDNIVLTNGESVEICWFVKIDGSYNGNGSLSLGSLSLIYN